MIAYTETAPSPPSPSRRWGEGSRKLSEVSAGSYMCKASQVSRQKLANHCLCVLGVFKVQRRFPKRQVGFI